MFCKDDMIIEEKQQTQHAQQI
jgi:hypothetical protein